MSPLIQKLFKLPAVIELTGKKRSSIYQAIKDGEFPAPISIGARAVAWTEKSIADWQQSRINASAKSI